MARPEQIDVLVNNAGFGIHAPIEKGPLDEFRKLLETNVHRRDTDDQGRRCRRCVSGAAA